MEGCSKALLDLEAKDSSNSSFDSRLRVCNNNGNLNFKTRKSSDSPDKKPAISSVPKSQVLGKTKDFLKVISEANKRMQLESKDLMLGVTDLHTPQAVAAAQAAMAGHQPVIPIAGSISGSESSEESSGDDTDDEDHGDSGMLSMVKSGSTVPSGDKGSVKASETLKPNKRPKIVEL